MIGKVSEKGRMMSHTQHPPEPGGQYVSVNGTRLYVVERGEGFPLIVLHGGPGLDHHMFANYLDPLCHTHRLLLVDQRAQGRSDPSPPHTWKLTTLAEDIHELAAALNLRRYVVLGHSFGAIVALQHAVDFAGQPAATIISGGVPSACYLRDVDRNLETFEPESMRHQVSASWAREADARTPQDVESLLADQVPFHFADPLDPRIPDYTARTSGAIYSPDVLRYAATHDYGAIEVEDRLDAITQPLLVMTGRHDRTTTVRAAEAIAQGVPHSELAIFEHSGHMTFVEENAHYLRTIRHFLEDHNLL